MTKLQKDFYEGEKQVEQGNSTQLVKESPKVILQMLCKYSRSQNQLPLCISVLHNIALMLSVSDIKRAWLAMSLFLWPISNAWQCPHLRHTDVHSTYKKYFWSECREHIWAMKLENEAFGSQRRIPCLCLFQTPIWKLTGGYFHCIMIPSPLKSQKIPLICEARAELGEGGGFHSPCFLFLFDSSWFKIENLGRLSTIFQYIKITRQAGKNL